MSKNKKKALVASRRGDTIVEAVIAIAIYSIVAVLALASMNSGLKSAQKNLESTMSRAAVDSQVDTIRYIYDGYIRSIESKTGDGDYFQKLWKKIKDKEVEIDSNPSTTTPSLSDVISDPDNYTSCQDIINNDAQGKFFALNPRAIASQERIGSGNISALNGLKFADDFTREKLVQMVLIPDAPLLMGSTEKTSITAAPLYPRIVYRAQDESKNEELSNILIGSNKNGEIQPTRNAIRAEGVWVDLVKDKDKMSYDFYVRTCWNAAGEKSPTTFTTVVRVYRIDS